MSWQTAHTASLTAVVLTLWSAPIAKADDQGLVGDYLNARGIIGAVVRPIADDYVARTFPNFGFFGVIFRQYPVAVTCPQGQDLKCANVFFVKDGKVDFFSTLTDLKFLFAAQLGPVPSADSAIDAASTWLRLSEELKQDLFFGFSAPEISYTPRDDITQVLGHVTVISGGEGHIDMVMTLGAAGSLVLISERSAIMPGVRPICQATKLLDRDPIVRRMAEQDILVMGPAAKSYLDQVRATARPKLQQAIDLIWQRILEQSR